MRKIFFMMLALVALTACSNLDQISGEESNDAKDPNSPVELSGTIEDIETRGAGVITDFPSGGLVVKVYRADMNASLAYSKYTSSYLATVESGGKFTFTSETKPTYFANVNRKSKFITVYPSTGNFNFETGKLTFSALALDGTTDLMCTDIDEGDKQNKSIDLAFSHMLAKIEVKVKAKYDATKGESLADVRATWGEIDSIKVVNKRTGAEVTLPVPTGTGTASITATTDGMGDLPLDGATSVTLEDAATNFGYAMFVPSSANEKLSFKVYSTGGGEYTATSDVSRSYEAGKNYIVIISFAYDGTKVEIDADSGTEFNKFEPADASGSEDQIELK
jgi:hypothetical protein